MPAISADAINGLLHSLKIVLNLPAETQRIVVEADIDQLPKVYVVGLVPIDSFGGIAEAVKSVVVDRAGGVTATRLDGE